MAVEIGDVSFRVSTPGDLSSGWNDLLSLIQISDKLNWIDKIIDIIFSRLEKILNRENNKE